MKVVGFAGSMLNGLLTFESQPGEFIKTKFLSATATHLRRGGKVVFSASEADGKRTH
jgi:hypothetical protein